MLNLKTIAIALVTMTVLAPAAEAHGSLANHAVTYMQYANAPVPYVHGLWKIDRSDNIMFDLEQHGSHISAEFTTASGYRHVLSGVWNEATGRFDFTIERQIVRTGSVTVMFGHLTVTGSNSFVWEIVGTDGRSDLRMDYHELFSWRRV